MILTPQKCTIKYKEMDSRRKSENQTNLKGKNITVLKTVTKWKLCMMKGLENKLWGEETTLTGTVVDHYIDPK